MKKKLLGIGAFIAFFAFMANSLSIEETQQPLIPEPSAKVQPVVSKESVSDESKKTVTTSTSPKPSSPQVQAAQASPPPAALTSPAPQPQPSCDPNYTPCVPNVSYDLDCSDISFSVRVIGTDHHRFDREGDGLGCESN